MLTLLLTILAVGLLVTIHEGGHFLVARLCGMHAYEFSVGFGPQITSFTWRGTQFRIGIIPLGGYVRVAGLNPYDEDVAADDPRSFPNRPLYQRIAVIAAGPGMNYFLAILLAMGIFAAFVPSVRGSYTNVVGLPLAEVAELLVRTGAATLDLARGRSASRLTRAKGVVRERRGSGRTRSSSRRPRRRRRRRTGRGSRPASSSRRRSRRTRPP